MIRIAPAQPKTVADIPPIRGAAARNLATDMGTGDERREWRIYGPLSAVCIAVGVLYFAWEFVR